MRFFFRFHWSQSVRFGISFLHNLDSICLCRLPPKHIYFQNGKLEIRAYIYICSYTLYSIVCSLYSLHSLHKFLYSYAPMHHTKHMRRTNNTTNNPQSIQYIISMSFKMWWMDFAIKSNIYLMLYVCVLCVRFGDWRLWCVLNAARYSRAATIVDCCYSHMMWIHINCIWGLY